MSQTRDIRTNFSKGELSPLLEGHSDLAAYFEGAATLENFVILRQGGIRRSYGSRFVNEAKVSDQDVILIPFEASATDAYVLEVGHLYIRIYKGKGRLDGETGPVEVVTPYTAEEIRTIQFTQSADVMFLFHENHQQRRLNRVSDTEWTMSVFKSKPPPSVDDDSPVGATIALAANTGNGVTFRLGPSNLLAADAGRQIIIGAGRAVITTYTDTSSGVCDIIDDFNQTITASVNTLSSTSTAVVCVGHGANTDDYILLTSGAQSGQFRRVAVVVDADNLTLDAAFSANQTNQTWTKVIGTPESDWRLRLAPQTTLDPNLSSPVGGQITLVAGAAAFRTTDVGRYIGIYGGIVKITARDSSTQVRGTLQSKMADATSSNPAAAPAGSWTLEDASWSDTNGWPITGEFFQGRLYQASTSNQQTTFWGSASDQYDVYARGVVDSDSVSYTVASRQLNRILWISDLDAKLVLGTGGAELTAEGSGSEKTLITPSAPPYIDKVARNGVARIQPIQATKRRLLYIDKSLRKVFALSQDPDVVGQNDTELTVGAEHITASGVRLGPLAFKRRLDPRLYVIRSDGQLVTLTFSPDQKVMGFTRRTTVGTFESVCVVPTMDNEDRVWVVVKRTINGVEKRYIEFFEDSHETLSTRLWSSLQLDCGIVMTGLTGTTFAVPHLAGQRVGVVKNGVYLGLFDVEGDSLTLVEELAAEDVLEVGIMYTSSCVSMRPAKQGAVIDGVPRSWDSLFVRLYESLGGKVNGEQLEYPTDVMVGNTLHTGDIKVNGKDWDTDGRISIVQDEPYPMTVLASFGTLSLGEHD